MTENDKMLSYVSERVRHLAKTFPRHWCIWVRCWPVIFRSPQTGNTHEKYSRYMCIYTFRLINRAKFA